MRTTSIDIKRTVKKSVRLPFEAMAKAMLPAGYELSLVICGDDLARRMNIAYRKKGYRPNVLSFPITRASGEIFLNVRKAEREARAMGVKADWRIAHLFVHGCAHLTGHDHSDRMEALETRVLKKFGFNGIPQ